MCRCQCHMSTRNTMTDPCGFVLACAKVVFNGLWFGFPGSRKLFTDDLKQRIINTCAEWTQGLRPHTVSHSHWNVSDAATGKDGNRRTRTRQVSEATHCRTVAGAGHASAAPV